MNKLNQPDKRMLVKLEKSPLQRTLIGGLLLFSIFVGVTFAAGLWDAPTLNAQRESCSTGQPLEMELAAKSGWDLCWSIRAEEGVVLHDLHFTTPDGVRRKVMKEASVGQIVISPDDSDQSEHLLGEAGLGGQALVPLIDADCPSGQILAWENQNALCQRIVDRGYIYRYFDEQRQGEFVSLYSLARLDALSAESANPTHLLVEWRLYDDGTIEPIVELMGNLATTPASSTTSEATTGYVLSAIWRLDIDIGANGDDDIVEEFEVREADGNRQRVLAVEAIETEAARQVDPNHKRSWRVRAGTLANTDGHVISYQLEARTVGHQLTGSAEAWHQNQLYVTVLNPCERLATQNPQSDNPDDACGESITDFVDDESLVGQDPVLWYTASAHRMEQPIPGGENPQIALSFLLIPRDWSVDNPLVE